MPPTPDLNTENPRGPREECAGLVWIPRMADKARAADAGCLGEFMYPCPMDKLMLDFLELEAERFSALVLEHPDAAFSNWLTGHLKNKTPEEIAEANRQLLAKKPDTPEKQEKFDKIRNDLAPSRQDITTWAALIDLEEGRA